MSRPAPPSVVERFLSARVREGRTPGAAWWIEGPTGEVERGHCGFAALVPGAEDRTHLLRDFGGTASSPGEAVPDPFGGSLERYRKSWSQINEAIEGILPKLIDLSGEISGS